MFTPATQNEMDRYDRAVDSAIATCGGDLRGALKALIIANEFLEENCGGFWTPRCMAQRWPRPRVGKTWPETRDATLPNAGLYFIKTLATAI